jgi:hypothetical protein
MSTATDADEASASKLPLSDTLELTYATYFSQFGDVLRISWLWLALTSSLIGATAWLQMSWLTKVVAIRASSSQSRAQLPSLPIEVSALANLANITLIIAGVSIAVAWHRRQIMDERPRFSAANIFTKNLWRYVGIGIALYLMFWIPTLISLSIVLFSMTGFVAGQTSPPSNPAIVILLPITYLMAGVICLRLMLLLPARAVGNTTLTFKQTWIRTRGNGWRLFWGLFACSFPPAALAILTIFIFSNFANVGTLLVAPGTARSVVGIAIFFIYGLLTLPIMIGFMSHAYRHFFVKPI